MNTLRKASLNHFRVVSVSVCVKPTPPHRLDLGVRGRMRRRAKPGGEVAGGDGKADRKGPRGAEVAACFESSARELGRTANSESESSSRMRP